MADSGEPEAPHPHNVHWTGLLAFGGIVTVLGAAITGFAKPSTGSFNFWTYPSTYVAYFGLLLAFVGLLGLVRGWEFPLARRRDAQRRERVPTHPIATLGAKLTLPKPFLHEDSSFEAQIGDGAFRRSPQEVWDLFNGLTDLQAAPVIRPFIGQSMVISGRVSSVTPWDGFNCQVSFQRPMASPYVAAYFEDKKWLAALSSLKEGDEITVRGTIETVTRFYMFLGDSELL
jgi:hypothetical protein